MGADNRFKVNPSAIGVDAAGGWTFTGAVNVTGGAIYNSGASAMIQVGDRDVSSPDWGWYARDGILRLWNSSIGDRINFAIGAMTLNIDFAGQATYPKADNTYYCGFGGNAWISVAAYNYPGPSDIRLKEDITDLPADCLELVRTIMPQRFRWIKNPERQHWGFVAQNVDQVMRAAGHDFGGHTIENDTEMLDKNELLAVLWQAVTELTARVQSLEGSHE
jgi:hypothetical protein